MIVNILPSNFLPLPFYFFTLETDHTQEKVYRPNGFLKEHLMFVTGGTGILKCDGEIYPLKKGCGFYIKSGCPHEYVSTGDLKTAWVTYDGTALPSVLSYYKIKKFLFCENLNLNEFMSILEQIKKEYYYKKRESIMSSLLYQLIILFFDSTVHYKLSPMDKTELYIERNFKNKITLDELVAVSGFSKSKFCQLFKKTYGQTAFEKILNMRLSHARQLLKMNLGYKIKEVAFQCGFEDISYFCQSYKKKYGVSPKQDFIQ